MKPNLIAPALLTALITATAVHGATTFTDRTAFENAVSGSLGLETFDLDISHANSIVFASGIQSDGANGIGDPINRVTGGAWETRVRTAAGASGYLTITWTLPGPSSAIGIDFSSISSSRGVTITADWDGAGAEGFVLWDQLGTSNAFFGVIGTSTFTQITLSANGTGDNDFFGADDVAFELPSGIFADGFESGDVIAWTAASP